MIRNFVSKLPKLIYTNNSVSSLSVRSRTEFHSLSPYRKPSITIPSNPRSSSCSRTESIASFHNSRGTVTKKVLDVSKHQKFSHTRPKNKEFTDKSLKNIEQKTPFLNEAVEQYELEAARPRSRNQDLIRQFRNLNASAKYSHLQPDKIKPFGSQEYPYAPILLKQSISLKMNNAEMEKSENETESNQDSTAAVAETENDSEFYDSKSGNLNPQTRSYSTTTLSRDVRTRLNEEKEARVNGIEPTMENADIVYSKIFPNGLSENLEFIDKLPPKCMQNNEKENEPKLLAAEIRKKEKEHNHIELCCKYSYSDLLKIKLSEKQPVKYHSPSTLYNGLNIKEKTSGSPFDKIQKLHDKIFVQPQLTGKRTFTAKSKSNIDAPIFQKVSDLDLGLKTGTNTYEAAAQKSYNKSSRGRSRKGKKSDETIDEYAIRCGDVCTPVINKLQTPKIPYEPEKCDDASKQRFFITSKVRLPPAPCTPRPQFTDCIEPESCPPRADECKVFESKKLPYIPAGNCPCIDPPVPSLSPKLKKLNLRYEDPPKPICVSPSCQTPRMDDLNPPKYKPLKPYIPGDCECIDPPPMTDVKIKRLPKCSPEEDCKPVRVCPVSEGCPPRADECLVVKPKKLPCMPMSLCPCVDPPQPQLIPKMKRLNLSVPEPEKICPQPSSCLCSDRADGCLEITPKKLPKLFAGACPCEDNPMVDWNIKRLECVDQPRDCIVPDPCLKFPRADWGCWEYSEDECIEVEERCIEKKEHCPQSKPYQHPCDKKDPCEYRRKSDAKFNPSRNFSSATNSMKLYMSVKANSGYTKNVNFYQARNVATAGVDRPNRRIETIRKSQSFIDKNTLYDTSNLIRQLGNYNASSLKHQNEQLGGQAVSESLENKSKPTTMKLTFNKPMSNVLNVLSRSISTSQNVSKNEKQLKHQNDIMAKKQCENIKPSIKSMCKRPKCPIMHQCSGESSDRRNLKNPCKYDAPTICCEKDEAPYAAYSDVIEYKKKPYVRRRSFNCDHPRYGFYPNYKKAYDPLDSSNNKDQKKFSTASYVSNLPIYMGKPKDLNSQYVDSRSISNSASNFRQSSKSSGKAKLKKKSSNSKQKIIVRTSVVCPKPRPRQFSVIKPTEIKCEVVKPKCKSDKRHSCIKLAPYDCVKKVSAPFPAFSDCLDEEMEETLSECPLDREKYLKMQPKFIVGPCRERMINPPSPDIGLIDTAKEEECINRKLKERGIENEGLTQTCETFGELQTLKKSKTLFIDTNAECDGKEKRSNSRNNGGGISKNQRRSLSTRTNSIELTSTADLNHTGNFYIRNYHALVKNTKRKAFNDEECKNPDAVQKICPEQNSNLKDGQSTIERIRKRAAKQTLIHKQMKCYYAAYKVGLDNAKNRHAYSKSADSKRNITSAGKSRSKEIKFLTNRQLKLNINSKATLTNFKLSSTRSVSKKAHYPPPNASEKSGIIRHKFTNLQPGRTTIGSESSSSNLKTFCDIDDVDKSLGKEYYKIKHGLKDEGITFDCSSSNLKESNSIKDKSYMNKTDTEDPVVEVHIREHRVGDCCCDEQEEKVTPAESHSNKEKLFECPTANRSTKKPVDPLCLKNCIKNLPCHLPEEEKYNICSARCLTELEKEAAEKNIEKSNKCPKIYVPCDVPAPSPLPPPPPRPSPSSPPSAPISSCINEKLFEVICKPKVKRHTSLTLKSIIRRIINYFKARPGCPGPHEWKAKALKEKADKAAKAIGFMVVDPKCIPPEMLKTLNACMERRDCKVCPPHCYSAKNQPQCQQFKESRPLILPKRHYSKRSRSSCNSNLDEINKMLEENEQKTNINNQQQQVVKSEYSTMFGKKMSINTTESIKLSLQMALNKRVDLISFCYRDGVCSSDSYFGYPNTLPSRENILEQAWRQCIEAYNRNNQKRACEFFNKFLIQLENSLITFEDLEKLKTENVLRQLDEFLKETDSKKNKK